jgi:hypothetical protein
MVPAVRDALYPILIYADDYRGYSDGCVNYVNDGEDLEPTFQCASSEDGKLTPTRKFGRLHIFFEPLHAFQHQLGFYECSHQYLDRRRSR